MKKPKVLISTNIAPLYVQPLWELLVQSNIIDFDFISSVKSTAGIATIDNNSFKLNKSIWKNVKNIYFKNALIYQKGLIQYVYKKNYDIYIFSGEMYNISTWISCFICKLKKKKIIFWGHGYYGDELGVKKIFRILFYKIPDINFLYGNRSKDLLEKMGFEQDRLVTVFNSLDYDKLKIIRENIDINYLSKLKRNLFPNSFDYPVIVFVGRLTKEKKIALLLNSIYLLKKDGVIFNLLIIGDGIDKNNIVDLSNSLQLTQHINFYGSCYDDSITGNLLLLSDVCVSPGHVGLTAIHSMSLGIPVITHNNFAKQAPEVEAIKQNYTGLFFKENDANDLAKVILDFVHIKKSIEFRINCINEVELNFTPLNQYNLITNSILKILESD